MKIAINTLSIIPGEMGGTETFLVNLVKNLIKIDKKNEYLLVVSCNNKRAFITDSESIEYLKFNFDNNSRVKRVFFEQINLLKKLKEKKVDLLIAPGNTGLICCPCKLLLIVHDLIYFIYPKYYSLTKRIYLRNLVKYSCKKADRIVTISQNTKNDIIKYVDVSQDKINVIYEGVDFERFSNIQEDAAKEFIQKEYGIQNYIYSPTSLYQHKNNDLLIKAFAKLKKAKRITQKLIITGLDPLNKVNWLKGLIQKYNLSNEVIYLGMVSNERVPRLYNGADFMVYLSSYEGFGLPIIEAMASGCPVLSSNQSSLPEVVGDAGILVSPFNINEVSDRMYELLTNENLRKELIAKGLALAKKFSWENTVKNMLKIYERI